MAKISQLTATTSPADTDSLPIENTSGTITTKRITISSLASTIANKVRSLLSIGSASSLKTSSKEIVGAVNEVHDAVDTYATNTERLLTDHQQQLNWCSDGIIDLQDSVNSLNTKTDYANSIQVTEPSYISIGNRKAELNNGRVVIMLMGTALFSNAGSQTISLSLIHISEPTRP